MRNASILSFTTFLLTSLLMVPVAANVGLWLAFIVYILTRAVALAVHYSAVRARSM
jgi:hypothetical protein